MKQTGPGNRADFLKRYRHFAALALIAGLSFFLNFYAISRIGFGNAYYAAAIKSMSQSFKNFFFVAFDPAGVVSVDKPPLALWIQTVFVLIFGYHGWAMLLPQALAGVGSSLMMYALTARFFGRPAGLVSALTLSLTPAVVVASRNNTMDMQLIFFLLVAVWFLFRAMETGRWRPLFLAALFVGLGFNVKMLQAYMILPAVAVTYLLFARGRVLRRILGCAVSLAIMAAVSFAWVIAVDLTPAADRPYVGSSTDNTVIELIVGHNGMERLYGQGMGGRKGGFAGGRQGFGGFGGAQLPQNGGRADGRGRNTGGNPPALFGQDGNRRDGGPAPGNVSVTPQTGADAAAAVSATATGTPAVTAAAMNGFPGGTNGFGAGRTGGIGGMGGAGNDIGTAGPTRLWQQSLYGQASWLIVFTVFAVLVKLGRFSWKKRTAAQGAFVFWVIWLLTMVAFFSFAGFWHRYYLCMLAPGLAGLTGPGLAGMVSAFGARRGWKQALLPLSLLATLIPELVYVWGYASLRGWLFPLMAAAGTAAVLMMAVHLIRPKRLLRITAAGLLLLSILSAPFWWCMTVVLYPCQNSTMPYAGPELASQTAVLGMTPNQENLTTGDSGTLALEKYLVGHYRAGSYLVVAQRADDVAQFIVDTGLPAVAYGGFLGTDNAMTLDRFKELVSEGKITYFLVTGMGGNSEITSWVEQNATLVESAEYSLSGSGSFGQSGGTLYSFVD